MPDTPSVLSDLPRPTYAINELRIVVILNRDMKTAKYKYEYEIDKFDGFNPLWTHTFAYPVCDVKIGTVRGSDNNGPEWKLTALESTEKNAQISINLLDTTVFSFEVETKIESTSNITFLGGDGCVAFWVTHGSICKKLTLELLHPSGFSLKHVHPGCEWIDSHPKFRKDNLLPKEFFMVFLTYEKTVFGIPPKAARFASKILWLMVGAVISTLFSFML